jgi:DNA-binding GntR family transcriptional regulator
MRIDPEGAAFPYQQIANWLRREIQSGRYPPGARLPSMRALERDLSCGRMTVQHALKVLEAEGLIFKVRGRGTFVTGQ